MSGFCRESSVAAYLDPKVGVPSSGFLRFRV